MGNDLVEAVAREIGDEIFSDHHGCLCDPPTEDLQMNVRGHISLPAIARIAIAAYEAANAARIRELEEALKPFAVYAALVAREHPGWDHDAFVVGLPDAYARGIDANTLGPFRRARAAYEGKK